MPDTKAVERHAELGDTLLPWALGIFVVAAAVWLLGRRFELTWRSNSTPSPPDEPTGSGGTATMTKPGAMTKPATRLQALPVWATLIVAVLAIGVSAGGVVQLYRIGDSGSKAAWGSIVNRPPH